MSQITYRERTGAFNWGIEELMSRLNNLTKAYKGRQADDQTLLPQAARLRWN